jgi:hypothetical protein
MKIMPEKKLRKMGMMRMKNRVMGQCLGKEERKSLPSGDREPHRVLKFNFPILTGIHGD